MSVCCRPAAHEGVDSNMPPIGIPGSIDWPQGRADAYYFATIQMRQPSGVIQLATQVPRICSALILKPVLHEYLHCSVPAALGQSHIEVPQFWLA